MVILLLLSRHGNRAEARSFFKPQPARSRVRSEPGLAWILKPSWAAQLGSELELKLVVGLVWEPNWARCWALHRWEAKLGSLKNKIKIKREKKRERDSRNPMESICVRNVLKMSQLELGSIWPSQWEEPTRLFLLWAELNSAWLV